MESLCMCICVCFVQNYILYCYEILISKIGSIHQSTKISANMHNKLLKFEVFFFQDK